MRVALVSGAPLPEIDVALLGISSKRKSPGMSASNIALRKTRALAS
jgi:hypothetical protein